MKTLRVGLIGAGGISQVHATGWAALDVPVTVYSHEGAEALAAEYGFAVAPDLDALLAASDIVDIVTSSSSHKELALAAIAAGKHVICEKPLSVTAAEARELADAAEAAGVRLFPAHVVRFFPEYAEVKRQVDGGRIGEPAVLRFVRGGQAPRAGSWFFDENAGGGIILDQMIHDLDQARWLAGEVTQVYAVQSPASVDGIVPGIVTAHVTLTHAGGAISHVQGTWGPEGTVFRTSADVAGTGGTLAIDSRTNTASTLDFPAGASGDGYLPPATTAVSPYTRQLAAFLRAIADDTDAVVSAEDGIRAVAIAEAAAESLRTGRAVDLDPATGLANSTADRESTEYRESVGA